MSKQTALQWFLQELETKNGEYRGFNNLRITHGSLIEQALQMEREQIVQAHGIKKDYSFSQIDPDLILGDEYYEQTYGGKE
jgi:hypothetical protein